MQTIENTEFSVLDVETTGLFPAAHDRIIEIAILRVDHNGNVLRKYESLFNPDRDIGPTHIHGIHSRDVKNAPHFEEIAGDVIDILAGSIVTAHNASFDVRFIRAEMSRINCCLPDFPYLCTLNLARRMEPQTPSRKLCRLCEYFHIPLSEAHSAQADAQATADLLRLLVSRIKQPATTPLDQIGIHGKAIPSESWPRLQISGKFFKRKDAAQANANDASFVAGLISKLPVHAENDVVLDEYFCLLDQILEDRRISNEEINLLSELAQDIGLSQEQARQAHQTYMKDLLLTAYEDGIFTDAEKHDIQEVQQLLSISDSEYRSLHVEVKKARSEGNIKHSIAHQNDEIKGKGVCFTGALACHIKGENITRSQAEKFSTDFGMIVKKSVTKDLDILVLADPDSMSGKAKKARSYGVRLLAEAVYWRMIGIDID